MTMSPGNRPSPSFCSTGQSRPTAISTTPKMISQRLIAKSYPRETGGPSHIAAPESPLAIAELRRFRHHVGIARVPVSLVADYLVGDLGQIFGKRVDLLQLRPQDFI